MSSQPEKVPRLTMRIGTHDGSFHCDEVLACWLLKQTEKFQNAEIIRTRDPKILFGDESSGVLPCDVIVDVGAQYVPEQFKFDHHQREFTGTFSPKHQTKLSSAGLIYKHFGLEILQRILPAISPDQVQKLYDVVYNNFIEEIDGVDNGVSCYPTTIEPAYRITTQLGQRVGRLNPRWNDAVQDPNPGFFKAIDMVGAEFSQVVDYYGNSWLPARTIVAESLARRFEVDPSGSIMIMETFAPWKEHLFELEAESGAHVVYVLFGDSSGSWRVQCVPARPDSFESRRPLPEPLRGLRDEALSAATGLPGGIFVHATGFIGGMKTRDAALALARLALA